VWGGGVLILDLKMPTSSASCALFFAVRLPIVHAKTLLLGLQNLIAAARAQTEGGKTSLLKKKL